MSASSDILENFERAFTTTSGGCRRPCKCGREFYNPDGLWSWDEGELEALEASEKATALDWTVGEIRFGGSSYVPDCDCWHAEAKKLIALIVRHDEAIAEFLTLEKQRKQKEADRSPVVK